MDHVWAWLTLTLVTLAGVSGIADYRRKHRKDLDRVGFMPWPMIMVVALVMAAFAGNIALRGG